MDRSVILVVGAGPGLGAAVARRYGRAGYDVALVGRTPATVETLGEQLQAAGVRAAWAAVDVTDSAAFAAAVRRLAEDPGRVDTLHFNPSTYRARTALELTSAELLEDLALGTAALLTAVQAARPFLRPGGRITATGSVAADRPPVAAASLGVQKAALRALVRTLDRTLAPEGVRAMTLTVNGVLAEGTPFSPDRVADALYAAATRPDASWSDEVPYDG